MRSSFIVEDELRIRMHAVEMIEEALKSSKRRVLMKPLQFLKVTSTSLSYSPISRCRAVWMISCLLLLYGSAGLRSRSWPLRDNSNLVPAICRRAGVFYQALQPYEIMKTLRELLRPNGRCRQPRLSPPLPRPSLSDGSCGRFRQRGETRSG